MKHRSFVKNSILALIPSALAIGALLGCYKASALETGAYSKTGSLVTTISLKDNDDDEIKKYYSALSDLSSSQLQGQNLLKNLKPILMNGQKYYKYDSDSLWALYEIIDRDWEKSPASAIDGYDSSTNTITGYKYGTSMTNQGTNPYIHALYVDRSVDNQTRAWDDHQQTQWGINQEHIWPKSQGFNASGAGGARGDPMHLWAGNGRVNGTEHNNNMYGFVDKSKNYTNPYEIKGFKNLKDNYSGSSLTIPTSTDTVFEPQDSDKGDIARAIFYMVARYNNIAGNDTTINQDNPNLALKQTTENLASYTTTYANKQVGYMGLMTDLLYWNHLDPVDEFEIHRNNLLFNNYTHNRNPFIDYPEWADYIWGKPVYNGRNYVSYSSTPTGSVNLTSDVINGFKGEQPQTNTVRSLEIVSKPSKLVYNAGEQLDTNGLVVKARMSNNTTTNVSLSNCTITPSGSLTTSDKTVTITYEGVSESFDIAVKGGSTSTSEKTTSYTFKSKSWKVVGPEEDLWTSNKDGLAFNDNQGVQVSTGTTGANATSVNSFRNVDKITVYYCTNSAKGSGSINIEVGNNPQQTFTVNKPSANGTTIKDAVFSFDSGLDGNVKITINCADNSLYIAGIDIHEGAVTGQSTDVDVQSVDINKDSLSLDIGASETLVSTVSPNNATVSLVEWSSSAPSVATVNDEGEVTAISAGSAVITCKSLDNDQILDTCTVMVNSPVVLTSITLSGEYATNFYLDDTFSSEGLIVTANYSNNTSVDVTEDVEISGYDLSVVGNQTVTVAYGDVTANYSISVKEKGLEENETIIIASQLGLVNKDSITEYQDDKSVVSVSFIKGSGTQPVYNSSTSSFRIYQKNSFTITSSKTMTKIEFEISGVNSLETAVLQMDGLNGNVWTGSSNNLTFVMNNSTSQRNIISIKVTYDLESEELVYLTSITLSGDYQTSFFRNDEFSSEGLVVTAHYSDESSAEVTPTSISSPNMGNSGNKTVTVSYTEGEITKTETYTIEVVAISTVSITLSGNYKTTFYQGEEYDPSGMRITEHYNNGGVSAQHLPTSQGCTITGYDMNVVGEQTVTVSWNGVSTTYTINVLARPSAKVYSEVTGYYLVEDASELKANDKLLIVGSKVPTGTTDPTYYALAPYQSGNNCRQNEIPTPSEGFISTGVAYLTLGGSTGAWTLYDGTYYLYAAGGTSTSNNYLKGADNANNANAQWKISIANGIASIETIDETVVKNKMRYNGGSSLFSCYSAGQSDISIYKYNTKTTSTNYTVSLGLTQAIVSAQGILDAECLAKKVTTKNWEKIKTSIVPFLEDSSSNDYKALMFGEAVSSEVGGNLLEDFLARYDLIVSQYGYNNFITDSVNNVTRAIKSSKPSNLLGNGIFDSNFALVILIVSSSTILAVGGYFFLKKKKSERK